MAAGFHDDEAPLFSQFWLNSELNPTRAALLRQRIDHDKVAGGPTPPLRWREAAHALPPADAAVQADWAPRRSVRRFAPRPLAAQALSDLLWPLAQRADGHRGLASGGGKYPVDLHVIGLAIDGQVPGTACYDPRRHGLVPTGPAPAWPDCQAVLGFECEDPPAAVLVLTARPQATLAKYGERGARFALLEAGSHLGALQAGTARAGLGGVAIGAFQDRALLALIGADPRQTLALLAYAVGHADD